MLMIDNTAWFPVKKDSTLSGKVFIAEPFSCVKLQSVSCTVGGGLTMRKTSKVVLSPKRLILLLSAGTVFFTLGGPAY